MLRQAVVKAIDKQTLLTRVLQGLGKPGQTEMPGVYPSYTGYAAGYPAPTFDIAGANQLLDQAGYAKGADGNRTDKSGKPLTLRLMGRNSDPTHAQMAEFVKGWLGQIGIPLTVSMVTPNQVNDDSTLGKYDLYFTGWGIGPDPDFQLSINQCSSRPNADGSGATSENNWCDPAFDALYKAQHTELDAAKRADLVKQAFTMIDKAAINSVIWYADTLEAWRSDKFTGFVKQPENDGVVMGQNGYWGLYGAAPVSADTASAAGTSSSSGMPGWAIGLVIVGRHRGGRRDHPAESCVAAPPRPTASEPTDERVAMSIAPGSDALARDEAGIDTPGDAAGPDESGPRGSTLAALPRRQGRWRADQPGHGRRARLLLVPDPPGLGPGHQPHPGPPGQRGEVERLRHEFGLDQPLIAQFFRYVGDLLTGNLGTSFVYNQSVSSLIADKLGPTLLLTGTAALISIVLGLWLGQRAAWRRGSWFDKLQTGMALTFWSVPTFWLGLILLLVFAGMLHLFPAGGMTTRGQRRDRVRLRHRRAAPPGAAGGDDGRGRLRAVPDGDAGVGARGDVGRLPHDGASQGPAPRTRCAPGTRCPTRCCRP